LVQCFAFGNFLRLFAAIYELLKIEFKIKYVVELVAQSHRFNTGKQELKIQQKQVTREQRLSFWECLESNLQPTSRSAALRRTAGSRLFHLPHQSVVSKYCESTIEAVKANITKAISNSAFFWV
jgi:hypothetical protein